MAKIKSSIRLLDLFECIFVFFCLAIGVLLNNVLFSGVGIAIALLLFVCSNDLQVFGFLAFFTPNTAIVVLTNGGMGLLGFFYLLFGLKLYLLKRRNHKISMSSCLMVVVLLVICLSRILNANVYDFAIMIQTVSAIGVWTYAAKKYDIEAKIRIILYFIFGAIFMLIGMIIQVPLAAETRIAGLLDDPNYTGGVFCVLFAIALLSFCYKLAIKKSFLLMLIAVLGGVLTGSRGFLLSVACVVCCYLLVGLKNKNARKVFSLVCIAIIGFFALYFIKVPLAVTLYDNTIGRTLQLSQNHQSGNFMDITSGRMVLWEFYLDKISSSVSLALFGRGFAGYELPANGGYGLAAHNAYIGGIMGIGVIGLLLIVILYWRIYQAGTKGKNHLVVLSIVIGIAVNYFFLDGLLDLRVSLYVFLGGCFKEIYSSFRTPNLSNGSR